MNFKLLTNKTCQALIAEGGLYSLGPKAQEKNRCTNAPEKRIKERRML